MVDFTLSEQRNIEFFETDCGGDPVFLFKIYPPNLRGILQALTKKFGCDDVGQTVRYLFSEQQQTSVGPPAEVFDDDVSFWPPAEVSCRGRQKTFAKEVDHTKSLREMTDREILDEIVLIADKYPKAVHSLSSKKQRECCITAEYQYVHAEGDEFLTPKAYPLYCVVLKLLRAWVREQTLEGNL